jgi:hypothetical protein
MNVMKTLGKRFEKLLSGFNASTPDHEIEEGLKSLYKNFGSEVSVRKLDLATEPIDGKRLFIIKFETNSDAVLFASQIGQQAFGTYGLLIEVG